jgi:elongation factor 1-beta
LHQQKAMAVAFPNLSTEAGLKHLDEYLLSRTFITGYIIHLYDLA